MGKLLIFAAFLSIVWRYYFWDVNICAAFVCVCVRVCLCVCIYVCAIGGCIQYMEENTPAGRKVASECMFSVSANR